MLVFSHNFPRSQARNSFVFLSCPEGWDGGKLGSTLLIYLEVLIPGCPTIILHSSTKFYPQRKSLGILGLPKDLRSPGLVFTSLLQHFVLAGASLDGMVHSHGPEER